MIQTPLLFVDRLERRTARHATTPWPPAEYQLPDTVEEIERGRPDRRESQAAPPAAAYARTSDTSREAAEGIASRAGKLKTLVLDFIRRQGRWGATDQEVAEGLNMLPDTSRARRVECRDYGLVVNSGRRRPTPTGRQATVWVAAEFSGDRRGGAGAEGRRAEG